MSLKQMAKVWEWSQAEGNARLVMLALADFCDDDGYCFPGMGRIAKKCRISERTVQRLVAELEVMGELRRFPNEGIQVNGARGPGQTNRFQLLIERGRQDDGAYCEGGDKTTPKGVTKGPKGGDIATSPDPSGVEPSVKPSTPAARLGERMAMVGPIMGRQDRTGWSEKEKKALRDIDFNQEDYRLIAAFYRRFRGKDGSYCRRDLLTLLNNWRGEVDRIREWMARNPKKGAEIAKEVAARPEPKKPDADEIPFEEEPVVVTEAEAEESRRRLRLHMDQWYKDNNLRRPKGADESVPS